MYASYVIEILKVNLKVFHTSMVISLQVYDLREGFKAWLETFWSYYQLKPPFSQLRSC